MSWFCIESRKRLLISTWTFCTKPYIKDHRENILKEIESHLVLKLKLQVRMWSRRVSLVTVATEILRFLSTIRFVQWPLWPHNHLITHFSTSSSQVDQWSRPNKHQVSLIISFVKKAPTWWVDSLQWETPPPGLQRDFSTSLDKTRPDPFLCSLPPGIEHRTEEKISINYRSF